MMITAPVLMTLDGVENERREKDAIEKKKRRGDESTIHLKVVVILPPFLQKRKDVDENENEKRRGKRNEKKITKKSIRVGV